MVTRPCATHKDFNHRNGDAAVIPDAGAHAGLDNGRRGDIVFVCLDRDLAREMRRCAFRAVYELEPRQVLKDFVADRRVIVLHTGPDGHKEHAAGFIERECCPDRVGTLDLAVMGFNRPVASFESWWVDVGGTDLYEHGGDFYRQAELKAKWRPSRPPVQSGGSGNIEPIDFPLGPTPDRDIPLTDLGNAERLVCRAAGYIRYCKPWGKWLVFDGRRWKRDDTAVIERYAKAMVRGMLEEAAGEPVDAKRKAMVAWQVKSESRQRIEAAIALAAYEEGVPVVPDRLDQDPWALNVLNGTLDLRTGELRPHRREDLLTCLAPVAFDPDAECPLWLATLDRVFDGRSELIGYVQRLFGLALTGIVTEQVLPIFWGSGANGKSTIVGALVDLLGDDYAISAPPGLLVLNRGDSHPTGQARLFGKRFVVDMETAEGARLNEALVKQLTGSDKISARRMREDHWDFTPTHKIVLCTNHKPEIRGTEHAIWRRIQLVPFEVRIPDEEQDKNLAQRLRAEFSGILAWCVRGCLDWRRDGLRPPDDVREATAEYRADQDVLGEFLTSECVQGSAFSARASTLYQRYRKWTEGSGEQAVSQRAFGKVMSERGFQRYTNNGTWYSGLGLRSDGTDNGYQPY